ncbi:hypothetical protein LP419_39585 [Massilia sp. H-1]|nr:hypothetical protein LP419_39585 [Massilia sp. H-1]
MGGLTNDHTYYVIIVDGDRAELAATREDAWAKQGDQADQRLSNPAQHLVDATSTMRAQAESGASGGDIGGGRIGGDQRRQSRQPRRGRHEHRHGHAGRRSHRADRRPDRHPCRGRQ